MKYFCATALVFLFSYTNPTFTAKVIAVKDGDTIVVLDNYLKKHCLRLADIDCPERGQEYGGAALKYTKQLCYLKQVRVEGKKYDRYHRLLARVYLPDSKVLNEELLKAGWAWQYKYSTYKYYADLMRNAQKKKIGLWKSTAPVPPWYYRNTHKSHPSTHRLK